MIAFPPPSNSKNENARIRVLLVEDDPAIAETLALVLEDEGFLPIVAYDGEEGLVRAQKERPDLLLLDVMLPHRTGPEIALALQQIKTGLELIPVVLYSASTQLSSAAKQVGTPYFIQKPFEVQALLDLIQQ